MCGIFCHVSHLARVDEGELCYCNIMEQASMIAHRGPDCHTSLTSITYKSPLIHNVNMHFYRLSIVDKENGSQPFIIKHPSLPYISVLMCNGEIYNYKELIETYNLPIQSQSDCEVIVHLYHKLGMETTINLLRGEYAFVIVDFNMTKDIHHTGSNINISSNPIRMYVARDVFGIRPLFYDINTKHIILSSEAKAIKENAKVYIPGLCMRIRISNQIKYSIVSYTNLYNSTIENRITSNNEIKNKFIESVQIRTPLDQPVGCLLSGGLDSSLVAGLVQKYLRENNKESLYTFTIGFENATDIKYAEQVSKHIQSNHTTFIVTPEEALECIPEVVKCTETYDITSIRASTMQYLLIKKIHEKYPYIKVFLCGEGSDELLQGYAYFKKSPSELDGYNESKRLLSNIHTFDGLRADRTLAAFGKELRLPFLDTEFVKNVLECNISNLSPLNRLEKSLIRNLFVNDNVIPIDVLLRPKEAFSDGCSSLSKSWFQYIQEYVHIQITDDEYHMLYEEYKFDMIMTHGVQKAELDFQLSMCTKERLYYWKLFKYHNYPSSLIPYYWLPKWNGNVTDPSARVLSVYTAS